MIHHSIDPVYDDDSTVLILGSFPSVKSRAYGFFYGHPQNRFWKVLSAVFERDAPVTIDEKKTFLLSCGVAVWDVIASCDITGSSDSSIRNVVPNDISMILETAPIRAIYVNGGTAKKYYDKYIRPIVGREAVCLPSTSPANASWSLERLTEQWRQIRI